VLALLAAGVAAASLLWARFPELGTWAGSPPWVFAAVLAAVAVVLLILALGERRAAKPRRSLKPKVSRETDADVFTSRRRSYKPADWTRAYAQKRQLPSFVPYQHHWGAAEESMLRATKAPLVIAARPGAQDLSHIRIARVENPAPGASLGYTGPVIR